MATLQKPRLFADSRPLNLGPDVPRFRGSQLQLLISDEPGDDPDGVATTATAAGLDVFGMRIGFLGFAINRQPADRRVALQNGVLDELGLSDCPVSQGSNLGMTYRKSEIIDEGAWMMRFQTPEVDAISQMRHACAASADLSVTLLGIAALTDIAALLRQFPNTAIRKLRQIVVMGGVMEKDGKPLLDERGFLIPEERASNHGHDLNASYEVFDFAQQNGIPLRVLTRFAASAAAVPTSFYDTVAGAGGVGARLRNIQKGSIQTLWEEINLPIDDPKRTKPAVLNQAWFWKMFCDGTQPLPANLDGKSDIWGYVKRLSLYDPLTLLLADNELTERFYTPTEVTVSGQGLAAHRKWASDLPLMWKRRATAQQAVVEKLMSEGTSPTDPKLKTAMVELNKLNAVLGVSDERADVYARPIPDGDMSLPGNFRSQTATHQVVGLTQNDHGVKDPKELASFLCEAIYHGCKNGQ